VFIVISFLVSVSSLLIDGTEKDSRLASLNPVLHNGLLRVKGRLDLPLEKCPTILPNSHHVTTLIIRSCHERNRHTEMLQVLSSLKPLCRTGFKDAKRLSFLTDFPCNKSSISPWNISCCMWFMIIFVDSCNSFTVKQDDTEIKKEITINTTTIEPINDLMTYFSNWNALQRAVAWLIRFKTYCKNRFLRYKEEVSKGSLTVNELQESTKIIVCSFHDMT
jgi:hypothetical protein